MERMNNPYLKLVENCICFARQFLNIPDQINIYFENCPSERFPTSVNVAESDHQGNVWFNKEWFTGKDRWNNHKDDIEFFVFHELRHMHQFCMCVNYTNGHKVSEEPKTIQKWINELNNYKRNTGDESQNYNMMQEVEIDANAYAILLSNLYHLEDEIELHFSTPEHALDVAMERIKAYEKKPEIHRFLKSIQMKSQKAVQANKKVPVRVVKIGRNEPCPCGSGLKYKKCSCKEYHDSGIRY